MKGLVDSDNLDVTTDPVRWQIYTAAVSTGFNQLFNHLLPIYLEFYFRRRKVRRRFPVLVFRIVCHD